MELSLLEIPNMFLINFVFITVQARENLLLHYETYVIPFQLAVKAVQFDVLECRANINQQFKVQITKTRTTLQKMRDALEKAVRFVNTEIV